MYNQINAKPELLFFLRHQPIWYRTLSRDPAQFEQFEKEAKSYLGKTIPQRVEKVSEQMQMMAMFLQMASAWKD